MSNNSGWSINKISFWTIVVSAIIYLIGMLLGKFVDSLGSLVGIAQAIVIVVMTIIVGIHAWKFVRNKQLIWIISYIVCLLIVVVCIILGLV